MSVYFIAFRSILRLFGIFCGHLVYFMFIWYIYPRFGILCQEKSGNPDAHMYSMPTAISVAHHFFSFATEYEKMSAHFALLSR
jgi:hypothetical protein